MFVRRRFDGGISTGCGWNFKVWISSEIKIHITFCNVWTVTNPMQGSTKNFVIGPSSTEKMCSTETLFERIMPVVLENGEFDYRNKTIKLNISWTFWLSWLWWRDHKYLFFNQSNRYKNQAFEWDLDGTNQVESLWEVSVYISRKVILKSTFYKFLTIRILKRGTKLKFL